MKPTVKRTLGLLLAAILIGGIVVALFAAQLFGGGGSETPGPRTMQTVRGVIGSEKKPFFDDPDVAQVFAEHGLDVQVTTAGSRQIATSTPLEGIDFAFPSSAPAAEKIKRETHASAVYSPFYSPLAIASFTPIAELLTADGITERTTDGQWVFYLDKYLAATERHTRWTDLPDAASRYNNNREILVSTTDIRQSNSAAMYLAMASYVLNGNAIVSDAAAEQAVAARLGDLFLGQGYSASSSEAPFEDYLSQGIGSKPLVMVYEAQFLGRMMNEKTRSAITDQMIVMTPSPTVLSKHTVVPLSESGHRVGQLLQDDPKLAELAARYGFRPADSSIFERVLQENSVPAPPVAVNVVEPPSFETLESLITQISERYTQPAAPAP